MRHLRIPGQNLKNLSAFKSQITNIIREINKFDDTDKNEAFSYIQDCIKNEPSCSKTTTNTASSKKQQRSVKYHLKRRLRSGKLLLNDKITKTKQRRKKKQLYKCKVCNVSEKSKSNMLKHLETHVEAPLSCLRCRKTFNGNVSFKWHLLHYCKPKQVRINKFKCNQCSKKFSTKRTLESHLQGHKRNNCTYCDKVITRRVQLIKHLLEEHSIKLERHTHRCNTCEKSYIKRRSLFYHMRQHVPGKFVCLECGEINETIEIYQNHKKQHDFLKLFTCQRCNEKFSRRSQYLLHLTQHDRYKCNTCNETFPSRDNIIKHKQLGHDIEGLHPRFVCSQCRATFANENRLVAHLRLHSGDSRTVNCTYCKKTFSSFYAYYKHCSTIFHEKCSPELSDIVCKICDKHFTKKYVLKQHIHRVHNKYSHEAYKCQYCKYETYSKSNILRHSSLHFRQNNNFTCEYCGKTCDNMASLKDHISYNHLQEKQFHCEKCNKSFKRNSELVRHRKSHSDERPYICTNCGKNYKRLTHLKRHEQSAHQIMQRTRQRIQNVIVETTKNTVETLPTNNDKILILQSYAIKNDDDHNVKIINLHHNNDNDNLFLTIPDNDNKCDDQLMSTFTPEKNWGIEPDLYKYYNDIPMNFEKDETSLNHNDKQFL